MSRRKKTALKSHASFPKKTIVQTSTRTSALLKLAPLGALAAGFGLTTLPSLSYAQTSPAEKTVPEASGKETQLSTVIVKATAEEESGKDSLKATTTTIGKGKQDLRDIPQSITVVTEKLIDDRNLDTLKDVLHNTAGITFQAAEGGEEDIRLRGFSLATTGDIFLDGMRDPAFYDRDTFNNDRIELLRGSASMLFGRGSTGGAVNQVSKAPRLADENEITATIGSHAFKRIVGDVNIRTGEDSAFRFNVMANKANNNGAGSSIDKHGVAGAYRWGIDSNDEFLVSLYYLNNKNGINYGLPWIKPKASDTTAANTIINKLNPDAYYGMKSDYNAGKAKIATFTETHRFSPDSELKTQVRAGNFERDLRAGTVRFAGNTGTPNNPVAVDLDNFSDATVFTRGDNLKIQDMYTRNVQSDYSNKFNALGFKHELLSGVDYSNEKKVVYAVLSAAQGGVTLTKPRTLAGTPDDGATVPEGARQLRRSNQYSSDAAGFYVQDLVEVVPHWKVLGGLRYDHLDGQYDAFAIPNNAPGPVTTTAYQQKISEVSKRVGVLYQPNSLQSFHFSYGTSFNTSGDTYSYSALSANTPPEESENIEFGAKLDSADKRFTTRLAIFRATKKNERNTDPDTAATSFLLSGKRHSAGFEIDFSGRLTPEWEVYGSYAWMPIAKVDIAAPTSTTVGNRQGDRPGLSPRNSGTVWSTYQLTPQWRVGGGVNFRSAQAPADVTAPAWNAPGYATVDLLAEYTINEDYVIKTNLTNVANKLYADSLYRGHYIPGAGRLLQVSLSAKF